MKINFYGYGYRETKNWSCSNCNNFHTCGMDLFVDESKAEHQMKCQPSVLKIFEEASDRVTLKDLVWAIYQDPKKVKEAIEALKRII
jgi:hypothetical protein